MPRSDASREVAIRDVDRDALFALGLEAVGQERQVGLFALRSRTNGGHLVLEYHAGVVEDAPDQRGFAVVDGADRHESEQLFLSVLREISLDIIANQIFVVCHGVP
jgi:hypothetical protein